MSVSRQTLAELNNTINKDVELMERRKISSLDVGKIYVIKKILFVPTRFGKSIIATLFDSSDNVTFQAFLPKRVVEMLSEDTIKMMNNSDGKYTITYLGQSSTVHSSGNTRSFLNFGMLE